MCSTTRLRAAVSPFSLIVTSRDPQEGTAGGRTIRRARTQDVCVTKVTPVKAPVAAEPMECLLSLLSLMRDVLAQNAIRLVVRYDD